MRWKKDIDPTTLYIRASKAAMGLLWNHAANKGRYNGSQFQVDKLILKTMSPYIPEEAHAELLKLMHTLNTMNFSFSSQKGLAFIVYASGGRHSELCALFFKFREELQEEGLYAS